MQWPGQGLRQEAVSGSNNAEDGRMRNNIPSEPLYNYEIIYPDHPVPVVQALV